MIGRSTLAVRTPDGAVSCRLHRPHGDGPFPAVLFFMDALGARPAMDSMADRLAEAGYFVFAPNLLYRAGDFAPFDPKTVWTDEPERARLSRVLATVEPGPTMRDVGLYLEALAHEPEARADRIGAVGYCLGGMLAFRAVSAWPEQIAAAASIHGGRLVTDAPDSPHLGAPRVKGRLYFGCADNDRSCTAEQRQVLTRALAEAGVRAEVELYAGKAHGWAVEDFPVYDRDGAERHWVKVLALFRETLC
jgi:carboxymethylenebutenolidase